MSGWKRDPRRGVSSQNKILAKARVVERCDLHVRASHWTSTSSPNTDISLLLGPVNRLRLSSLSPFLPLVPNPPCVKQTRALTRRGLGQAENTCASLALLAQDYRLSCVDRFQTCRAAVDQRHRLWIRFPRDADASFFFSHWMASFVVMLCWRASQFCDVRVVGDLGSVTNN